MKLIDLLVKELPALGGWPEGDVCITQDNDSKCTVFNKRPELTHNQLEHYTFWVHAHGSQRFELSQRAEDYKTAIITREQYAAKTWDGEGLPPVGAVCEMRDENGKWKLVDIFAFHDGFCSGWDYVRKMSYFSDKEDDFRFIITPEQIEAERRFRVTDSIMHVWHNSKSSDSFAGVVYDAIRAGKIKGVKIDE